jgi:hypothetical protein
MNLAFHFSFFSAGFSKKEIEEALQSIFSKGKNTRAGVSNCIVLVQVKDVVRFVL